MRVVFGVLLFAVMVVLRVEGSTKKEAERRCTSPSVENNPQQATNVSNISNWSASVGTDSSKSAPIPIFGERHEENVAKTESEEKASLGRFTLSKKLFGTDSDIFGGSHRMNESDLPMIRGGCGCGGSGCGQCMVPVVTISLLPVGNCGQY
jgi:hypothetical protein